MNQITGMNFVFRTLVPVPEHKDYTMSVGTVTFSLPEELPLDFWLTEGSQYPNADGTATIRVEASDFSPEVFEEEDKTLGVKNRLSFDFFWSRRKETRLTGLSAEYVDTEGGSTLPLTLESAELNFTGGGKIDYSRCISVAALSGLAEVA